MSKNTPERRAARAQRAAEALKAQQAAERKRNLMVGGAVGAVVIVIIGLLFLTLNNRDTTGDLPQQTPSVASGTGDLAAEVDGFGILIGDPDAPDTVTIYEDLQCPACASFESQAGEQINAAIKAGDIRVNYRMVSFLDQASTNDYSSRALNALLVVLEKAGPDAFKKFHDALYADQPAEGGAGFEDSKLIALAGEAGASEADVTPGIESKVYEQWIKNATDQMSKDGVNGTPSFLINGDKAEATDVMALLGQ